MSIPRQTDIGLNKLQYCFTRKPLLVGGKAMEYYGLRKAGIDTDMIAAEEDVVQLIKRYPDRVKNLWGDLGVCPYDFEIWRTICLLDYDDLSERAIDGGICLVISLEKLLLLKALASKKQKYFTDMNLVIDELLKKQYAKYADENSRNMDLLRGIDGVIYIEEAGPNNTRV